MKTNLTIGALCLLLLLSGCAHEPYPYVAEELPQPDGTTTIEIRDLEVVEDVSWTRWNLFWGTAAVGGSTLDVVSTVDGLDRGCREAHPLFGPYPSTAVLVLSDVVGLGLLYIVGEYAIPEKHRQEARNWLYAPWAIFKAGGGVRNYNVECN